MSPTSKMTTRKSEEIATMKKTMADMRAQIPTITRGIIEQVIQERSGNSPSSSVTHDLNNVTTSKIMEKLESLEQKMSALDELKNDFNDIKKSQQFLSNKFDQFAECMKEMKEEMKGMKNKQIKLREEMDGVKEELEEMKKINAELQLKQDKMEQYNKQNNLEFQGIVKTENENTTVKILDFCATMGLDLEEYDVSSSYRTTPLYKAGPRNSTNNYRPIAVTSPFVGIGQGSVLGPLLFLVYINDIATCSEFSSHLYADDTALLMATKSLEELASYSHSLFHI